MQCTVVRSVWHENMPWGVLPYRTPRTGQIDIMSSPTRGYRTFWLARAVQCCGITSACSPTSAFLGYLRSNLWPDYNICPCYRRQ